MRRICFLFAMLVSLVTTAIAQNAYYVYLRGGGLQVFYTDMVDSMTVSRYDADNLVHDNFVTQNVWTQDSLYTIALEDIDSISFVTPTTVMKNNVIDIEEGLADYVISCDSLTIVFRGDLPASMIPTTGNHMVYMRTTETFPRGFAGVVSDVSRQSGTLSVRCDAARLDDIFERFYSPSLTQDNMKSISQRRATEIDQSSSWYPEQPLELSLKPIFSYLQPISDIVSPSLIFSSNNGFSSSVSGDFEASLSLYPRLNMRATIIITPEIGTHISFVCTGQYLLEERLKLMGQVSKELKPFSKLLHFPIPIPNCPFVSGYFEIGPFCKADVEIGVDMLWTQLFKSYFAYTWSSKNNASLKNEKPTLRKVSDGYKGLGFLKGSLALGAYLDLGLEVTGKDLAKIYDEVEYGVSLEGNAILYNKDIKDGKINDTMYESLLGTNVKANQYWGVGFGAQLNLGIRVGAGMDFTFDIGDPIFDKALAPKFTSTTYELDKKNKSVNVRTGLYGGCFPTDVGIMLIDTIAHDSIAQYVIEQYEGPDYTPCLATFDNLYVGRVYKALPIIRIDNNDVIAKPTVFIKLTVKPVIDDAIAIDCDNATLVGHVEGDVAYLENNQVAGFVYSTDEHPSTNGKKVAAQLKEGSMMATIDNLTGGTIYYYQAYLVINDEYVFSDEVKSFITPFPVELPRVNVTGGYYYPEHFTDGASQYTFQYQTAIYVQLTKSTNVQDWGYAYEQNDGTWSSPVSLSTYNRTSVVDPRQVFYRNADGTMLRLRGYVTYNGTRCFGKPVMFPLNYPTATSLTLTGCTFEGTTTDVTFNGRTWKHMSAFRLNYTAVGAYWLKVGVEEIDSATSGWADWQEERQHEMVSCVDGANSTVIRYYYDDKEMHDKYRVRLVGEDATNGNDCKTAGYVTFTYDDSNQFTGCTLHQ